jgi:hypothetical protein
MSAFALATELPLVIYLSNQSMKFNIFLEITVSTFRKLKCLVVGNYSKIGANPIAAIKTLKVDLSLDTKSFSILYKESIYMLDHTIGIYNDLTPIQAYGTLNETIAFNNGRIFVGTLLSQNTEWVLITLIEQAMS